MEPDFKCRCGIHFQASSGKWSRTLHDNGSTFDVVRGWAWEQAEVCKERDVFGCMSWSAHGHAWLGRTYGREDLFLLVTRVKFHLFGYNGPGKTGRKGFDILEGKRPVFFILDSGTKELSLLVCSTWHEYVDDPMSENKKVSNLPQVEEIQIPQFSVFLGNGYLLHTECGRRCHHGLRHYTYLFSGSYYLKYAVAFAYGASSSILK